MKVTNIDKVENKATVTVALEDGYEIDFISTNGDKLAPIVNPDDDLNPLDICTEAELDNALEIANEALKENK